MPIEIIVVMTIITLGAIYCMVKAIDNSNTIVTLPDSQIPSLRHVNGRVEIVYPDTDEDDNDD